MGDFKGEFTDVQITKCENGFFIFFEGICEEDGETIQVSKRLVCPSQEQLLAFLHENFLIERLPSDNS